MSAAGARSIWLREMRQSARLGRTPWLLFGITLGIALLICSIGGISATTDTTPAGIGAALFQVFFSVAYLVVVVAGPSVAANAVASEREGRTWEAVQLTGLTPQQIARGKFAAAYTSVALYVVTIAPVGALPFLFGGVTATEVVVAFAFLFLLAGLSVAFGLAVSSLVTNLRGALVITIVLAVMVGPSLYSFGGFAGSLGAHVLWSQVPEGMPIWLPTAYARAPFGVDYVLVLIVMPLVLIGVPAWLLYEATVANLSGEGDDRSSGLKRWFAACTPLVALVAAAPSALAGTAASTRSLAVAGLCILGAHLMLASFLFAGEPPGPSRRVRTRWARSGARAPRRFMGPGLGRTYLLLALHGAACLGGLTAVEVSLLARAGATRGSAELVEVLTFAGYVGAFCAFCGGLAAWLRARPLQPVVVRVVTGSLVLLVLAAPWVVVAVGQAASHGAGDGWILAGAPSPFFAFYVLGWLEETGHAPSGSVVVVELACEAAWALLGLGLLLGSALRARRLVAEHDAAVAAAEARLS